MDSHHKSILILSLIFLVSAASDIVWLTQETVPPSWDESLHLTRSLQYYDLIMTGQWGTLIQVDNYYPPFYHVSTLFNYILFGTSTDSAIFQNVFYFGILLFSVYKIGKYFGNVETGLISALLISVYPSVFGLRRFFSIDNGLISMVALSIYLLILTNKFKNNKFTIYFGIISAIAILTKWTAIFFIIGPFLVVCYEGLWKERRIPNLWFVLMILIGSVIVLSWYYPHMTELIGRMKYESEFKGVIEGDPQTLSLNLITYYPLGILSQISIFFVPIFLIGLYKCRKNAFFLLWMIIPYLILTFFMGNKEAMRYTLGWIGAIAIMSGIWISSIKKEHIKKSVIFIVLVVGIVQLFIMGISNDVTFDVNGVRLTGQVYGTRPPISENWYADETMEVIKNDIINHPNSNKLQYVAYVSDHAYSNGLTGGYYAYMKKIPLQIISVTDFYSVQPFIDNYYSFGYIVIKDRNNSSPLSKPYIDGMIKYFSEHPNGWMNLQTYILPDNSNLTIYKNTMAKI